MKEIFLQLRVVCHDIGAELWHDAKPVRWVATAKYEIEGYDESVELGVRMYNIYVGVVALPVKGWVDVIIVQDYLAPGVKYVDVPDVSPVMLLCRSIVGMRHVSWIAFVHLVVEGDRFMIVMDVARGFYNYISFLVP